MQLMLLSRVKCIYVSADADADVAAAAGATQQPWVFDSGIRKTTLNVFRKKWILCRQRLIYDRNKTYM